MGFGKPAGIKRGRMDQQYLFLAIAVAGASALQSATGIGFGVIAGPVMLLLLNSGSAIQLSIALSLLIALVLAPSLRRNIDRGLLARFFAGSLLGLPLGLAIFLNISLDLLKLLAGLAVSFTLVFVLTRSSKPRGSKPSGLKPGAAGAGVAPAAAGRGGGRAGLVEELAVGTVSGLMGGSLAMPGPIPAAWMAARAYDKETVRATILTMFIFSYSAALALQGAVVGFRGETLWQFLLLVPPTLVGVFVGRLLAARLTERIFRRVLIWVLAATATGLFLNSIPNLVTQ